MSFCCKILIHNILIFIK